ncbi:hypothetical protein FZEAL_7401 [Fusarium zealandicum]|uniref:Protein kinase domain-containing protein n=1 Tax=Fusarium zealandicum TaxID=1053134 RepID=A0A8H4UGM7_9HYPO|nr:hypothetical protein FZEAL_7401 [Fusarium zealandicum]
MAPDTETIWDTRFKDTAEEQSAVELISQLNQKHRREANRGLNEVVITVRNELPFIPPDLLHFDSRLGQGSSFEVNKELFSPTGDTPYYVAVKRIITRKDSGTYEETIAELEASSRRLKSVTREVRVLTHPKLRSHSCITSAIAWGWIPNAHKGTNDRHYLGKLADFGCSLFQNDVTHQNEYYLGTTRYNAPEISFSRCSKDGDETHHKGTSRFEQYQAADCYSFGLLLWETIKDGQSFIDRSWLKPGEDTSGFLERAFRSKDNFLLEMATKYLQEVQANSTTRDLEEDKSRHGVFPSNPSHSRMVDFIVFYPHLRDQLKGVDTPPESSVPTGGSSTLKVLAPRFEVNGSSPFLRSHYEVLMRPNNVTSPSVGVLFLDNGSDSNSRLRAVPRDVPAGPSLQVIKAPESKQVGTVTVTPQSHRYRLEDMFKAVLRRQPPWYNQCQAADFIQQALETEEKPEDQAEAHLQMAIMRQVGYGVAPDRDQVLFHLKAASANNKVARAILPQVRKAFRSKDHQEYDDAVSSPEIHVTYKDPLIYLENLLERGETETTNCGSTDDLPFSLGTIYEASLKVFSVLIRKGRYSAERLCTALTDACRDGHLNAAMLIAKHCTDLSVVGKKLPNPLHWLIMFSSDDTGKLLQALVSGHDGSNVNSRLKALRSMMASEHEQVSVILPHRCIKLRGTPLHWAVTAGYIDLVAAFIRLGADVNVRNGHHMHEQEDGYVDYYPSLTPLDVAVACHQPKIVQLLLDHGSEVYRGDWHWKFSPFHMIAFDSFPFGRYIAHGQAQRTALRETLGVLCDRGLDINALESLQQTPLDLAIRKLDLEPSGEIETLSPRMPRYPSRPIGQQPQIALRHGGWMPLAVVLPLDHVRGILLFRASLADDVTGLQIAEWLKTAPPKNVTAVSIEAIVLRARRIQGALKDSAFPTGSLFDKLSESARMEILRSLHHLNTDMATTALTADHARDAATNGATRNEKVTANVLDQIKGVVSTVCTAVETPLLLDTNNAVPLYPRESHDTSRDRQTDTNGLVAVASVDAALLLRDAILRDGPSQYSTEIGREKIEPIPPTQQEGQGGGPSQRRFKLARIDDQPVIMETYKYKTATEYSDEPYPQALQQVRKITGLLCHPKREGFHILPCLGFFRNPRLRELALVFRPPLPFNHEENGGVVTLLQLYKMHRIVPLGYRIHLACALATAIEHFHRVGWVHKSIRSNNIAFTTARKTSSSSGPDMEDSGIQDEEEPSPFLGSFDISNPLLFGFEYSRAGDETTYLEEDHSLINNLYRYPARWGRPTARFEKSHDVYSLGVVLLEIALWKDIKSIVKPSEDRPVIAAEVAKTLMDKCQKTLPHQVGGVLSQCVLTCLDFGTRTMGMSEYEAQTYFQRNITGPIGKAVGRV